MSYGTTYYWKIVAWDNSSASSSGLVWNFTTGSQSNHPPNIPTSPSPKNGSTRISVNSDLSWTGGDPDPGDNVTYDVYLGTSSSPPKIVTKQITTSYDPGTLSYSTTYYWKIIAWDSHDNSTPSMLFYFTTTTQSGGGGEEPHRPPQNIEPIADASAGEPYQGVINSPIRFDGSRSYDPDGNITSWLWDFGDNTNANEMIVYHSFSKSGIHIVTLTVTDDAGETNNDTTTCIINQPNRPPTNPIITGTKNGPKNTFYTYTVISTDLDNDKINYIFNWGDLLSNPSGFLPSGTSFTANHSWTSAGRYDVIVTVNDSQLASSSKIMVYIDAVQTGDIGYLLDNNGDGIYDVFYSDISKQIFTIQQKDGNYNIDSDGNGDWDYTFDAIKGLTSYQEPLGQPGFELILSICAISVLVLFWKRK